MAEFEELKIGVSVSDDASEKLRKLRTEGERFNNDVSTKVGNQFKAATFTTEKFATQLRGIASNVLGLGRLPIFTGVGFAAIVTSIKIINDQLGSFARDILKVRDVARTAGLSPDQFKSYTSQLKLAGYTAEQAEQEIVGFFRTVEEAGRAGTPEFQRIWSESFNPEITMRRINEMRNLIRSGEGGKAITQSVQEAKAIMAREMASGHGMQEARRQAESWLHSVGLSLRALNVSDISDFLGDPTKWQRRIEAAEAFNLEYTKFQRVTGEIGAEVQLTLIPAFTDLNQALLTGGGFFAAMRDTLNTDLEDIRKIIALLEGDWQKFASLLPPGPLRRSITGHDRPAGETEGPPTPWGEYPKGSIPDVDKQLQRLPGGGQSYELSPEQAERRRRQFGRRGAADQKPVLQQDVQTNDMLLEEVKRLNNLLFEADAQETAKKFGPQFHNAPQGGAQGESNPIDLPNIAQPGGGAAAEARKKPDETLRSWRPGDPVTGMFKGKPYPFLNPNVATPLPRGGDPSKDPNLTGVSEGKGVASWFGQGQGWGDKPNVDKPGSNALRVPEHLQGISLSSSSTLGQFFYAKDPNTGLTYVQQQTDLGPGVRTQKLVDISVATAQREGYTKKSFEAMQGRVERGDLKPWEIENTGFGIRGDPTTRAKTGTIPTVETQRITQVPGGKELPSGMDVEFNPWQASGGPAWSTLDQGGSSDAVSQIRYNPYTGQKEPEQEPRALQRAVEGIQPGSDLEWQLRTERALQEAGPGYGENKSAQPPMGYGPGTGLPRPGELGREAEEMERSQKLRDKFNPIEQTITPSNPTNPGQIGGFDTQNGKPLGMPISLDRSGLDQALGLESDVNATGNLDVNVRGAPADVKVEGDGMFKGNTTLTQQVDI